MKKLLFSAYSLDLGGIEKALINLTNQLIKRGYEITIVLERKQGIFLEELNPKIQVIEYKASENKNKIIRKIINLSKRIQFMLKYKNKYDFSACFATYSNVASFTSRVASKNCCLWGHADYLTLFDNEEEKMKKFFKEKKYNKFKNVIFVSKEGRESFVKVFPEMELKTQVCNNIIDNEKIVKLSNEPIEQKKDENKVTFINVGRHDEKQKRLTRIIEVAKKLKQEEKQFEVWLIGDGKDSEFYKELVKKEKLEDVILFLGKKQNPYPYYKMSDCVILTSDYEGYPVVFLESFVLNKPIITTKVSDYEEVEQGFGLVTDKDEEDIYQKMKQFIEQGFVPKKKFDADEYNKRIIEKLEQIF